MKVLFLTNVPSPYRVEFFNQLGRECDLTVLYQKGVSSERDRKWKGVIGNHYKSVFMKGKSTGVDNAFCPEVIGYLKDKSFDVRIICGIASPTEMLAITYCKLHHIDYWLESDGGFAKSGNGIKETIKRFMVKGAGLYLSTGASHDNYYLHYGAEKDKLVRYPFSSVLEKDILPMPIADSEKQAIREKVGMTGQRIILSIGQFIHRKGFDVLLKAAKEIDGDIYIVGGMPTQEYIDLGKQLKLNNVHYEGFKTKQELAEYYKAADIFVLPTREDIWGLVVNEAMAYGLPIITTDKCAAGVELVKGNGYIVEVDNVEQFQEKANFLINNIDVLNQMAIRSLGIIHNYTIETMTRKHHELLGEWKDEERDN